MLPLYLAAALWVLVALSLAAVWQRRRAVAPATATPAAGPAPRPVAAHPAPTDPVGKVVEALRTRAWARRGLSLVSLGLLVGAVAMLGYPVYTNFYADRKQAQLDRQLASPELKQAYLDGRVEIGDSLTRIKIPTIGVDVVVVEGVSDSALRAGAGHYPSTALPCTGGNVGIAGHRTTYGRPFRNLDLLKPGHVIVLETPIGKCTYEVMKGSPFPVFPDDIDVVAKSDEPMLTLTTCHPPGSARQRLIVKARLVRGQAVDA